MDFDGLQELSAVLGSGAILVFNEDASIVEMLDGILAFFKHESCGQCTPCRAGTDKMVGMLQDPATDNALYSDLMTVMGDSSICGLGQAAANCVRHLIKYFPEEMA